MKKATIQLETLACPTCMQKIEGAVKRIEGVNHGSINVMFNASRLKAEFDENKTSLKAIQEAIEQVGYSVLKAVET